MSEFSEIPPLLPDWASDDIDPTVPSIARIYDYALGGSHNFQIDRELAELGRKRWPHSLRSAWTNRAFLRRAVTYCARQGVTQFLDIGSGIPTAGNVHEILADLGVDARVVYTDIDPVAVVMSRRILRDIPWATAFHADARDLDAIVSNPEVRARLNFDEPVVVLLVALLHYIPDTAGFQRMLAALRDRLAPGSMLVISHMTSADWPPEELAETVEMSKQTPTPLIMRTLDEIAALFDGFELVEPGLVRVPLWRPDPEEDTATTYFDTVGAVGVKPHR
ncbi:SAM-dependent methyltransferase [Nocardia sp. CDC159]|uniref:SAM-dependent methyltransferase n=1 Tax=Nocardia pulmonis TaxID=2951408 RepID=A0A9X2IXH5_9NOCA|nr:MULTISPECIES: SAM-dependent methyltransferase [Nocardia]MCM6773860.1 SAM-dependent methyltransferase [Nocardia pulmonis]MCM6786747.1 SAM-dependent methyltransferase [Nocardia sp. CDC159]